VSLAVYIKKPPVYRKPPKVQKQAVYPERKRMGDRFFFSLISLVGLLSLIFALWPYFSWQLTTASRLTAKIDESTKEMIIEDLQQLKRVETPTEQPILSHHGLSPMGSFPISAYRSEQGLCHGRSLHRT